MTGGENHDIRQHHRTRLPGGAQAEIERRFAARKKAVDSFEGFLGFELLRPVIGEDRYFVVTRWDSRENYEKWVAGTAPRGGARPTTSAGE